MSSHEVGEKRRTAPALLLIIRGKAFPKGHCFLWIVTCPRHINDPNVIRLRLLLPAVGQLNRDFRADPIKTHELILVLSVFSTANPGASGLTKPLTYHGLAHAR